MGYRLPYGERKRRDEMWIKGFLWCNECKQFLPVKKFYKNKRSKSNYGYRYYCTPCENHIKKNKVKAKLYFKEKNRGLKAEAVLLAGGKCQRCGFDEFVTGLDFHHVFPEEKEVSPTKILYSRGVQGAWAELDKCCLLCRNCHGSYGSEWKAEFIKRDGLGWTVGDPLPLDDQRYVSKPTKLIQTPLPIEYQQQGPKQLKLMQNRAVYGL